MRTHHPGEAPAADQPGRTATPAPRPQAAISRSAVGGVAGGRGQPLAVPVTEGMGTRLRWDISHVVVGDGGAARSAVHDVLSGPGQPLAAPVKEEMEARLGADFSDVRVHTDSVARASAADVGARAYTSGPHVVIGDGDADKHTLAHELTHVIQQRQGPVAGTGHGNGFKVSDPSDVFEQAAEANAARVMRAPRTEQRLRAARTISRVNPHQQNAGPARLVQRAKVAFSSMRPVAHSSLNDERLQRLIAILETGSWPADQELFDDGNVWIKLGNGETQDSLLKNAKDILDKRDKERTTGPFSVISRTADLKDEYGVIFSDDTSIRRLAASMGFGAYIYGDEKEKEVREAYPDWWSGLEPIIDQPAHKTRFYAKRTLLRGPRTRAAKASGKAPDVPREETCTNKLSLPGPCKRADRGAGQNAAMGNMSALTYARDYAEVPDAGKHTWEWLHLIGSAIGGKNEQGNLVAGTYDMNTLMIPLEQTIVTYSQSATPAEPMLVEATAKLWRNEKEKLTWVAEEITLSLSQNQRKILSFGPIQPKANVLTRIEYAYYGHIFERQAGLTSDYLTNLFEEIKENSPAGEYQPSDESDTDMSISD